jgi:prepilin-type processing-associated H-X9-DG protein
MNPEGNTGFTVHSFLLPYLDQASVYDRINFLRRAADQETTSFSYNAQPNLTAARTMISAFICPSDAKAPNPALALGQGNLNYPACYGWPRYAAGMSGNTRGLRGWTNLAPFNGATSLQTLNTDGVFDSYPPNPSCNTTVGKIADGLSQTAIFGERLVGDGATGFSGNVGDIRRTIFNDDSSNYISNSPPLRDLVASCFSMSSSTPVSPTSSSWIGASWMCTSQSGFNWYNITGSVYVHTMPPNSKQCDPYFAYVFWPNDALDMAFAASSDHPGGVNVAAADGSVRFVSNSVGLPLWWALGSRDGGESDVAF